MKIKHEPDDWKHDWKHELKWLVAKDKGKSWKAMLIKMVATETVYAI